MEANRIFVIWHAREIVTYFYEILPVQFKEARKIIRQNDVFFCSTFWCRPKSKMTAYIQYIMSVNQCGICSTLCLPTYLNDVCSTGWCLPTCVISSYLWNASSTVRCLPVRLVSPYLYGACSTISLPACLMSPSFMVSAQLYDVCLTVWCLLNCMVSAQLYVCLPVFSLPACRFLPSCMMCADCVVSALSLSVWWLLNLWCLPTCLKSAQLWDVCLPVQCLPTCMIVWGILWILITRSWDHNTIIHELL